MRVWMLVLAVALGLPGSTPARGAELVGPVAVLGPDEEPRFSTLTEGLRRSLQEQGHRDLVLLEERVLRGDPGQAGAAVERLVAQRAAVLVALGSQLARTARRAAPTLPIVFVTPGDPVAAGLVSSLARPGGDTTAITFEFPELSAKRLQLLKELAPSVRRVLVLYDPRDASPRQGVAAAREAAAALGLALVERQVTRDDAVARGLAALADADALLTVPGGLTARHHGEMLRAALARRRPALSHLAGSPEAEALASYGSPDANLGAQVARLVDKILRGTRAGDLPVERATRIELVVSLRVARALGLTIPPALLARADRVVE